MNVDVYTILKSYNVFGGCRSALSTVKLLMDAAHNSLLISVLFSCHLGAFNLRYIFPNKLTSDTASVANSQGLLAHVPIKFSRK